MNFHGENFKRILYRLGGGLAFRKKKCREYRERTLLPYEIIEKKDGRFWTLHVDMEGSQSLWLQKGSSLKV